MVLVGQPSPFVQLDGRMATMMTRKELSLKKITEEKQHESVMDGDLLYSPYHSRSYEKEPFQDIKGETLDAKNSGASSERSPRDTQQARDPQKKSAPFDDEHLHEMTDPSGCSKPFIPNTSLKDANSRFFSSRDLDDLERKVSGHHDDKKKRWTPNVSIHDEEEDAYSNEYIYNSREGHTQRGVGGLSRYKSSMTGDLLNLPVKPMKKVQDHHEAERRHVSSVFSPPMNYETERGVHTPHDNHSSSPPSLPTATNNCETTIMQWPSPLSSSSLSSSRMKDVSSLPFSHPSDLSYGRKASSSLHDLSSYTTTTTSPRDVSSDNSSTISEDKSHEDTLRRCTYTRGAGVTSKKGDKENEKEEKNGKGREEEDSLKLLIGSSHTTLQTSSTFFDVSEEGYRRLQNPPYHKDEEDEHHDSKARFSWSSSSSSPSFPNDEEIKNKKVCSSSSPPPFPPMTNHILTRRPEPVWRELDSFASLHENDENKEGTLSCLETSSSCIKTSSSRRQSSALIPPRFPSSSYCRPLSYHKNTYPPSLKNLFSSFSSSSSASSSCLVSPSACRSKPLSVFCERRRQNSSDSLPLSRHRREDVYLHKEKKGTEEEEEEEEEEHLFSTVSPSCSPPPSCSSPPPDSRIFSVSFNDADEESFLSPMCSSTSFSSSLSLSSSHGYPSLSPLSLQGLQTFKPDSPSHALYPLSVFSCSSSRLHLDNCGREISSFACTEREDESYPFSERHSCHNLLHLQDLHHPDQRRGLFFRSQDMPFLKDQGEKEESGEGFFFSRENLVRTVGGDEERGLDKDDRSLCLHKPLACLSPNSSSSPYITSKKIEGKRGEREKREGGGGEEDDIFITSAVFFREQRFSSSISWAMFLLGVGVFLPWNCLIMEMAAFDVLYFPTFPWTEAATQVRTACFFLGQLILLWIGPRLKLFPRTIGTLVFSSLTNLSLALIVVFLKNERIAFHICCVLSGLIGLQGSLLHASVYVLHAIIHHELAVDWSIGGGLAGPITAFLAFPLYFLLPGLTPQWSSRVRTVILFGFASLWSILSVTALALAVKNPFVSRALSQQEQMKSLFLLNRKKMKTKQSDPSSSSSSSSSPKRGLLLSLLFLHDRGKKKAYLEEQGRREREDGQHELLHEEDEEEEERKLRTDSRSSSLPNEDDDSDKSSRSSPRSMMLRRLGSHREEGEREGKQRRDDPYDSNGYSLLTGWRFRTFRRLPSALFERGKSFVLDIFHDPESRRNEGGNDRGGRRRSLQDDEEESSSSFLHHNDLDVREERRRERPIEEDLGERRSGANQDERKQEGSLEEEENEGTDQRQPLLVLSHEEESHDEERGREPQDRRDERKKKGIEEGEEETSLMNSKEKKFTSPCPCESSGRTLAYITDRQKKTETTRSDLEKFRYEEDHCITHHKRRWRRRDVMWNIRSNLLTCFLLFLSTYIVYPVKTERLMPSSNTQDFVLFQMILVACFQAGNVLGRFFVFWGCRAPFSCLLPLVSFRLLLIPFFFFLDGSLVLSPTATPAWMKPDDALWLSRDPANEATTSSHTFLHDQLSSSSSSSLHNALDREKLPQRAPEDFSPPSSSSSRLYGNHPLLHPHHRHSQHILASPLTSPSSPPEASLHDIQLQHRHNGTSPLSSPPPSDLYLFPDLFSQQPQDSSGFLALLFPFGDVTALELRGILSDLSLFLLMMVFSTLHGWLSVLGAYYATQVPSSSAQKETAAYLMCLAESCGVALGAGLSIIWASLTGCHPLSPHHHHGYRPAGIGSASTPSPSLSSSTPFSSSSLSSSSSSSFMGRPTASYHEMTSPQSVGDSLSFSPWLSAPMSRVEGRRRSDMFSLHPFLLDHGIAATSSSSSFHAGMARVGRAGGQTGPLLASSSSPPPLRHVPKIG